MENVLISACLLGVQCRYDGESKPIMSSVALMEHCHLIPICPEQLGGLPTPRAPSERRGEAVVSKAGADVTEAFVRGAQQALHLAKLYGCTAAVLKERSPSCGSGEIYDGTFSGRLTAGDGVTAALLKANGVAVYGESEIDALLARLCPPDDAQPPLF